MASPTGQVPSSYPVCLSPTPVDGNNPNSNTTEKVNGFVIFGQLLIIGMAVSVTGILGVTIYGLALKVSTAKPVGALMVTAVVSGFFGEIFIAHGKNWADTGSSAYQLYVQGFAQDLQKSFQSYINLPLIQNQKPGLVNQGNTCFINGSLQALFALPPYRAALLETAKKEHGYYTAWIKLYRAIIAEQDAGFTEWSDEEMKGAVICLARNQEATLSADEIKQLKQQIVHKLGQQKPTEAAVEGQEQPQLAPPGVIQVEAQKKIQDSSSGPIESGLEQPRVAGTDAEEHSSETATQNEVQERIQNNKLCFTNCLIKGGLLQTSFSQTLESFKTAHQKGEKWPDIPSDLSASFVKAIQAFKEDPISRKYFEKFRDSHEVYQKTFAILQRTIEDYEKREQLLLGDVTKLTSQQAATPGDIELHYLRNFVLFNSHDSCSQQDAGEFIIKLLECIRPCDYPGLFAFPEMLTHLQEFKPEDEEIRTQLSVLRSQKKREEHVNEQRVIRQQLPNSLIQVTFPNSDKTGQEALNAWMSFVQPEQTEQDRAKNAVFYVEGDFFIQREDHVLKNFPDYLIVSVKRFIDNGSGRKKISTPLTFTESLMIHEQKYRIVAISIHTGSLESGHYTALVHSSGQWWQCNDHVVSKATELDITTGFTQGYIYCLEKVVDQPKNA